MTTSEIARLCEVSGEAVKKWIHQGKIAAFRTPGGHFRISREAFDRFRDTYRFPAESFEVPRILVVDDEPEVAEAIADLLRALRPAPTVELASNGYEGLLKIGTFRPDVLLLDLRMPGLDGLEVCRRVKSDPAIATTKIVAITGFPDDTVKAEAFRSGAAAFLSKPLDERELCAEIGRLLGASVRGER